MTRHRKILMLGANVANSLMEGRTQGETDSLSHILTMGKSCNKFGPVLPSGLGDSVMDGQKDGWTEG